MASREGFTARVRPTPDRPGLFDAVVKSHLTSTTYVESGFYSESDAAAFAEDMVWNLEGRPEEETS